MVHEFCKLARNEPIPEELEYAAGHGQRIQRKFWRQLLQNVVCKFLGAAIFRWLSGHMPALVVEAAHQHRKLSTEMHRDLRGQPVTQRMQHGAQRIVSVLAILEVQLFSDSPEPDVGLLNAVI